MNLIAFLKKWTLPFAITNGTAGYFLFSQIELLQPIGNIAGPILVGFLPYVIFLMLYITFCKINVNDMKPRPWHFILQGVRILLSALLVYLINLSSDCTTRLFLQGVFICVICPTAAAAPVITEKLGGSISSLTIYMLLANVVTAIIIPLFFPMVEKNVEMSFFIAFLAILKRITLVLVVPLALALLTRRFLPQLCQYIQRKKDWAFYLWAFNLSIVIGLTLKTILHTQLSGTVLALLLIAPLIVAVVLFSIGKAVGYRYGESIGAGQALGQKNTIVGIWLTIAFLNPAASIAPCAYVIWQNLINAWQLWYKEKYGILKW